MLSADQLSLLVRNHLGNLKKNDECIKKWGVVESALGGRGLVATEDIAAEEVLYIDYPLVYGPRAGTVIRQGCTVCRKFDDHCKLFKCPNCALFLCSDECRHTKFHSSDCSVISSWKNKIPIEDIDSVTLSRALTSIRALSMDDNKKLFMTSLEAHQLPEHGSEVRLLKTFFDIPPEDMELMILASCTLDTNAFEISTSYKNDIMSLRGLYPVAGIMNHCCVSNTRHSFNENFQMTVRVTKPISAGSELYSCYSGMLWGTPARRIHLFKTKKFLCMCDRCADPTERGTMLAALKCLNLECSGSLLPVEPLKMSSPWRCQECRLRVPARTLGVIQSVIASLLGKLDFEDAKALEKFLLHKIKLYIPETNQIVLDLECRLVWIFGEQDGFRWHELSESRVSLKERLCRAALRTLAALGAGDAHLRGLLLYHLHATLCERVRRTPALYEELKSEMASTIEQAYNILHEDISAPPDLELRRRKHLGPDSTSLADIDISSLNINEKVQVPLV